MVSAHLVSCLPGGEIADSSREPSALWSVKRVSIHSCTHSLNKLGCKWKRVNGKFCPVLICVFRYEPLTLLLWCYIVLLFSLAKEPCLRGSSVVLFSLARRLAGAVAVESPSAKSELLLEKPRAKSWTSHVECPSLRPCAVQCTSQVDVKGWCAKPA